MDASFDSAMNHCKKKEQKKDTIFSTYNLDIVGQSAEIEIALFPFQVLLDFENTSPQKKPV